MAGLCCFLGVTPDLNGQGNGSQDKQLGDFDGYVSRATDDLSS